MNTEDLVCYEQGYPVVTSPIGVDGAPETPRYLSKRCKSFRRGLDKDCLGTCLSAIEEVYKVQIPRPNYKGLDCESRLAMVKAWMEGADVRRAFKRCGRSEREGGRFSVKLLKKSFPEPCECIKSTLKEQWVKNQTTWTYGDLPQGFVEHLLDLVHKEFPVGWDSDYVRAIARNAPKPSACTDKSRKDGGARAAISLDDYLAVAGGERSLPGFSNFKYAEVPTAGKLRPLTVTPAATSVLRPLHKIIFGRIARKKWCLVGPPTTSKMSRAGFTFKDPILSGDYKGATDSLDLRVASLLLGAILVRARVVPETVKGLAMRALCPTVDVDDKHVEVIRGTMMGSLLSFPLLCLYNRVVSTFALGNVPMLINGDDLIAETPDPEPWFRNLPPLGMIPERTKSGYSDKRFEINSTPFVIREKGSVSVCQVCPTLRTRALVGRGATAQGIGAACAGFTTNMMSLKEASEGIFLRHKMPLVIKGLSKGLSLASLGFCWKRDRRIIDRQLFGLARLYALRLPAVVPPPRLISTSQTLPVYGTIPAAILRKSRKMEFGQLFGSVDIHPEGKKFETWWWDELRTVSPYKSRQPISFPCSRYGLSDLSSRSLYHGEILPKKAFSERLKSSLESTETRPSRVHRELYLDLSVCERWGLSFPK